MRSSPVRLRCLPMLLGLLLLASIAGGCSMGDGSCPGNLGDPCTVLCCPGLVCGNNGYCVKSCQCHAGAALCVPSNLADGCPSGADCVATDPDGSGQCTALCQGTPCPAGEQGCASAPDGTAICVGAGFVFIGTDGGAPAADGGDRGDGHAPPDANLDAGP